MNLLTPLKSIATFVLFGALLFAATLSVQTGHAATVMNTNDSGAGSLRDALVNAPDGDTNKGKNFTSFTTDERGLGFVASLVATVKEQAAQIQKVSAQLELNKPAPETVKNNH